jgi:hypothetical protein
VIFLLDRQHILSFMLAFRTLNTYISQIARSCHLALFLEMVFITEHNTFTVMAFILEADCKMKINSL